MTKPRIYRTGGVWVCECDKAKGRSVLIDVAYWRWVKMAIERRLEDAKRIKIYQ